MWICTKCGSLFSAAGCKKGVMCCPDCGSKSFVEANYCKTCHDYFVGCGSVDYCPDCIEDATDQLRRAIEKWIDPDYIDLLRNEYPDLDYVLGDDA